MCFLPLLALLGGVGMLALMLAKGVVASEDRLLKSMGDRGEIVVLATAVHS